MKLKWIFFILILLNCQKQHSNNTAPAKGSIKEVREIDNKDELYIGKEFYSGDELNIYTFITSGEINKEDSLTYSIYKKNDSEEYLLSIEKLMSNEDQELYKVKDIFKFTDYNPAKNTVKITNQKNGYSVSLLDQDKTLKKWEFACKNKETDKNWNGEYEGNFLRIKEESADPRAYATIDIQIENKNATFQLDSYNEIINRNLLVSESAPNKITLIEKDNKNSTFTMTKNNTNFILTSDLLNKITGEMTTYKLKKNL